MFERLVEQFPNAGKYWKLYIEQEVNIHFSAPCLSLSFVLFLNLPVYISNILVGVH